MSSKLGATEPIYHKNDTQLTATANVIARFQLLELDDDLKPLFKTAPEDAHIVATDKTVFYAQGGGQPADVGTMEANDTVFQVKGVRKAPSGAILHMGTFSSAKFNKDDVVQQQVDADTRKLHSQIHDGGHVVGLAVRSLGAAIGEVNELKAQHYPESSFVDFKGVIDGKHKDAIEAAANEIIKKDLPIMVCWWTLEELKEKCWYVPEGLSLPEGELARAVDIEGAGAYPCGGTHMRTTGEIGAIGIRKISRSKGVSKISYFLK